MLYHFLIISVVIYFAGVRWSFLEGTWGCLVLFTTAIVKKSPFCFCCCSFVSTVLCGSLRRRLAFSSEKLPNVIPSASEEVVCGHPLPRACTDEFCSVFEVCQLYFSHLLYCCRCQVLLTPHQQPRGRK